MSYRGYRGISFFDTSIVYTPYIPVNGITCPWAGCVMIPQKWSSESSGFEAITFAGIALVVQRGKLAVIAEMTTSRSENPVFIFKVMGMSKYTEKKAGAVTYGSSNIKIVHYIACDGENWWGLHEMRSGVQPEYETEVKLSLTNRDSMRQLIAEFLEAQI